MEKYCQVIMDMLWDNQKADELIARAANFVSEVANDNFDRDNIRTLPFTEEVMRKCGAPVPIRAVASIGVEAQTGVVRVPTKPTQN